MYIASIPNRGSRPTILLRESHRVDGKVKNVTLANLTKLPDDRIALLKRVLAGEDLIPADQAFEVVQTLPHGHVAAVLGTLHTCELWDWLEDRVRPKFQTLAAALIVSRIIDPKSKLATSAALRAETALSSLGVVLGLGQVDEDDLYETLDWFYRNQDRIQRRLAAKHLSDGTLVLYDVSSSYLEGRCCPLAQFGHSRDRKTGKAQIVYGLLCSKDGYPIAIEVFEGNTGDPTTLKTQVEKLQKKFGLERVVLVADRGMITAKRIEEDLRPAGIDWITALRATSIRALIEEGTLQPSLFDERDLAEIESSDFPGERLIVCRNPLLADERSRKREDLLKATEAQLEKISVAVGRKSRPLKGKDKIALRVGKVLDRHKMAKHFDIEINETIFIYKRNTENVENEAAADGFYVLRTNVAEEHINAAEAVTAYKQLARVERAFRCLKTVDLQIRPIYHRLAQRVRAHAFLCMLAYYVEWHMRKALSPVLYEDHDRATAEANRKSPVAKAQRSDTAKAKDRRKHNEDGIPVLSFRGCLDALATLSRTVVTFAGAAETQIVKLTTPTKFQARAFDLLGVKIAL